MTIGVKRLSLAVSFLIVAVVATVAGTILVVPVDNVRDAVKREIRAVTGLAPNVRGAVSVSMFPSGTVTLQDVAFGDASDDDSVVTVEELTANLRLMPLLMGRIEIADISLIKPHIAMTIEPDGSTNWSPLVDTLARALKPDANHDDRVLSFSEIRISGGVLQIRNPARKLDETLEAVEISLAWPSIAKSFAATGHFTWRDQNVDASVSIADFPAALAGANSGLKFRVNAAPLKAAFDGSMSYAPSLKIDGTLAADAASFRDTLRWTGDKSLPAGGLGRFALKARAGVNGGTIALSNLNVELDGNVAEGVLSYAMSGRRMLQGTLAVEKLDLGPYVSTLRLIADQTKDWDDRSIAIDWFNGWEADLRMSAAAVHFAHADLGRTAVAASMRAGRLTLTVGESQSFGGLVTGSIALSKTDAGAEIKSQMQFADVNLETCLAELFNLRRLEGTGNLSFAMDTSGLNVQEMTRNLNGTVSITAKQGALTGLSVEPLLRRLQRSPLSRNGDFRSGRTPFDKLNIALRVTQGTAKIEDVHLDGPSIKLAVAGTSSVPTRELDLTGTAGLMNASDTNAAFELPFMVQGRWEDPIILPDAQTLIQRSPAAGPLRDAIQDKITRDAVRSIIDRLAVPGSPEQRNGKKP